MADQPQVSMRSKLRANVAYIGVGLFVLIIIIWMWSANNAAAATPIAPIALPSQSGGASVTPSGVVPASPASTPTSVGASPQYCVGGAFCNGTPVPANSVAVGGNVCGAGNIQYACKLVNGKPTWVNTTTACAAGMPNMCPTNLTYCANGRYADGSLIPAAEAQIGTSVCGGGNIQYKCVKNANGSTSWVRTTTACPPTMKGYKK